MLFCVGVGRDSEGAASPGSTAGSARRVGLREVGRDGGPPGIGTYEAHHENRQCEHVRLRYAAETSEAKLRYDNIGARGMWIGWF